MSEETVNYKEEVLRLVAEGKIKQTNKYIEKASDETLEKIYKSYLAKQLDETDEYVADTLIKQFSELATFLELVGDPILLREELENNELFKKDVKNILGYVTPYIPFIGLACGGICLVKYMMKRIQPNEEDQGAE